MKKKKNRGLSLTAQFPEIQSFVEWMVNQKGRSCHTVTAYLCAIRQFIDFLEHYHGTKPDLGQLQAATLTDVRAFLSMRALQSIKAQSSAVVVSALKTYYRFLRSKGVNVPVVMHTLRSPRIPRKMPRPLSIEQVNSIISMAPQSECWIDWRDHSLTALLYATGLRIHEALSLNMAHWALRDRLYVVGKGGKERMIPLLKRAFHAVEKYRQICPYSTINPDDPLFFGKRGRRLQASIYQKYFRSVRCQMNLPSHATPHSLRHSFASHLLDHNASLRDVQEMMGHASLRSTQRYTASSQKHLQEIYRAFHPDGDSSD